MSEPNTFDAAARKIAGELVNLLISKQHDYGPGNIMAFGEFGVLVRANDKIERLKNLLQSGKAPQHEAIADTWQDLANYAIIALMLRQGTFTLPLSGEDEEGG